MAKKGPPIKDMLIPTMGRTTKYVQIIMDKRLSRSKVDLTLKQFILLFHVTEGGRPQSELAVITERDKGSLTRLIQSLERKGFIARKVSKSDKRINIVEATTAGKALIEKANSVVLGTFKELTINITQQEEKAVLRTIRKIMTRATQLMDQPNLEQ